MATKRFKRYIFTILSIFLVLVLLGSDYSLRKLNEVERRSDQGFYLGLFVMDFLEFRNEILSILKNQPNPASRFQVTLSESDIKSFVNTYKKSLKQGFISDGEKDRRNGEATWDGDSAKIKIAVHGTSLTPLKSSYGAFRNLLPWERTSLLAPSRGGWSFRLKMPNNGLYKRKRRINLITPFDDWTIGSTVLNHIAHDYGVISPDSEFKSLTVNGYDVGIYLLQEAIDKVMLERVYQITHYAVVKPSDDWDTLDPRHSSLYIRKPETYEFSGSSEQAEKQAFEAFIKLQTAIDRDDSKTRDSLLDIESFAKVSAIEKIYGTNHSTAGDNIKYLYDASLGNFLATFRAEGRPQLLHGTYRDLLEVKKYQENPVLSHLEKDPTFLRIRNRILSEVVNDIETLQRVFLEKSDSLQSIESSSFTKDYIQYKSSNDLSVIVSNAQQIRQFLDYRKAYVTAVGNERLEIVLDSYSPLWARSCVTDSKENLIRLEPSYGDYPVRINDIPWSQGCADSLKLIDRNGEAVDDKHIYRKKRGITAIPEINQENREDYITFDEKNSSWEIGPGELRITNSISFPLGHTVTISPGTALNIDGGQSLLIRGDLIAKGTEEKPIVFTNSGQNNYGTIAVLGRREKPSRVVLHHVEVKGGSEATLDAVYFSAQMSLHYAAVEIDQSSFSNSSSDDGLNIKNSDVFIGRSRFFNNAGDQIDLDFCHGEVVDSKFFVNSRSLASISTDGLDLSGSNIKIARNLFDGFSDKGISIGEVTKAWISENMIENSSIGIAVKDGSKATLAENKFQGNHYDVSEYVKKNFFGKPQLNTVQ